MNYLHDSLLGYSISSINTYFCTEEELDNSKTLRYNVDNTLTILSSFNIYKQQLCITRHISLPTISKNDVTIKTLQVIEDKDLVDNDTLIFMFPISSQTIPSCMLDYMKNNESLMNHKTIYCVMYCDEYETDYCDYAQEIMELYSKKTNANL